MRFFASSVWALTVVAAASVGAPACAQIYVPLNIYEQAGSKTCVETSGCRVDFGIVPKNLTVRGRVMPSLIALASWRDVAERQPRRSRTRTMTQ